MKKIIQLLKNYWNEDFQFLYYTTLVFFLALLVGLNYAFDIEQGFDQAAGRPIRVLYYLILYSIVYGGACTIMFFFKGLPERKIFRRSIFIASLGVLLLSFNAGFPYTLSILQLVKFDHRYYYWIFQVFNNLLGLIRLLVPLLIISFLFLSNKNELLGLKINHVDLRPYLSLLVFVFPMVIIASFATEFKNYYPTFQRFAPNDPGAHRWIFTSVYELSYGVDFINVELLFRGFFVIGLSTLIGRNAVVPMVALYCSLHFGKPLGETISSIFGGYILGVIAYHTRTIWGGVIVHIGLAGMMEIIAYWQRQ